MFVKVRGIHIVTDHLRKLSVLYVRRSTDFIKVQTEIQFCKPHLYLFSENFRKSISLLDNISHGLKVKSAQYYSCRPLYTVIGHVSDSYWPLFVRFLFGILILTNTKL